jgi:hypothetical protein
VEGELRAGTESRAVASEEAPGRELCARGPRCPPGKDDWLLGGPPGKGAASASDPAQGRARSGPSTRASRRGACPAARPRRSSSGAAPQLLGALMDGRAPLPVRGEVLHRWKGPLPLRGKPWMEGPPACACVLSAMGSWEKRKRERGQGAVIWKGRERWSAVARKPRSRMERSAIEVSRDCSRMERSTAGGRDARKPRRRWGGGWQNRAPLVVDVYTTYLCSSRYIYIVLK